MEQIALKSYRIFIISTIVVVISYFSCRISGYYTAGGTGPFPVWWGVLFFITAWVLPKIHPKLKLSLQESMILMIVIWASTYTNSSGWNPEYSIFSYSTLMMSAGKSGYFVPLYQLTNSPYMEAYTDWIPSYWSPTDPEVISRALTGGPMDWAAWATPIVYWIVLFGVWYTCQYCWSLLIRKPLVEVERLSFPSLLTPRYMVQYAEMKDEKTGRFSLLSFRFLLTKVFWAFFIIGALAELPSLLGLFFAGMPIALKLITYEIHLEAYTQDIFPGAEFFNGFMVGSLPGFLLLPVNALATFMWTGVLLHLIYPTLGIRLGWMPYEPGSEIQWGLSTYGTMVGPFKHIFWAQQGVILGLGVWIIVVYRRHIIDIFKAGFGNKELPQGEGGMSYRVLVFATLGLSILSIILLTASGMPAAVSVFWIPLSVIGAYGLIRFQAESADWTPTMNYVYNWPLYDYGSALGYWGAPPADNIAAYRSMTLMYFGTTDHTGMCWIPSSVFAAYGQAHATGVRVKDTFIAVMIATMGSMILSMVFDIYFGHVWGLSDPTLQGQTIGIASAMSANSYGFVTSGAAEPYVGDPVERYGLIISGVIFAAAMAFIHRRFPWIPWSPTGFLLTIWWAWYWLAVLAALIIKVIVLRIGGARAYDEFLMPAIVAFIAGNGTVWYLIQIAAFFMQTVPGMAG